MKAPETIARRILIVDDEPIVCDSIRKVLALEQHEVEAVTSSQDALAALQAGKFDLIILDYEMPGMKGDKLAATIKARAPQQPIIMMTAYSETLRLSGEFPLAVDRVIGKPFEIEELLGAVRQTTAKL